MKNADSAEKNTESTVPTLEEVDAQALAYQLQRARKDSGMTQEQVAITLKISRPIYIEIEKGKRRPTQEDLAILADLFGRTVKFILEAASQARLPKKATNITPPAVPNEYRDGVTKAFETLIEFARRYRELERLSYPSWNGRLQERHGKLNETILPEHESGAGEELAEQTRRALGLEDAPLGDLQNLLDSHLGVRTLVAPLSPPVDVAYGGNMEYGKIIVVNRNLSPATQRERMVRALAYLLQSEYKSGVIINGKSPGTRILREDRIADSFATEFLLPRSSVRRIYLGLLHASNHPTELDLIRMACYFGVSIHSLIERLKEMKLHHSKCTQEKIESLSKWSNDLMIKQTGEVLSHKANQEKFQYSDRYILTAMLACQKGKLTLKELAERLSLKVAEVEEFCPDSVRNSTPTKKKSSKSSDE